nr:hypothetical protein [Tanacetum cinerariifolium]
MSADSAVTYTSVHSEARSWSIPSEDPYEEAARQLLEQALRCPEYVPDPIELEDHVPLHIPEHPKDLVPAEDEANILEVASTRTPPLSPSFLSPRIRPLHTRAAMAQMKAAVPSTYHSLLPSGTPPLLPIPLHHIMRTQALEAGARIDILDDNENGTNNHKVNTSPTSHTSPKALINQGVAAAMAEAEASRVRNGYDINGLGPRLAQAVRECTYLDFLKCQPLNFKGTEGVVGLTQWSHSYMVELPCEDCYSESCLGIDMENFEENDDRQELALMCDRTFPEESDRVEKYIGGLPHTIDDNVKATRPKAMQEAIEFATELMDRKIRTFAEPFTAGPGERKEYAGTLPLCNKCKFHHNGQCTVNCKRVGHLTRDCRSPAATNNHRNPTCYQCGNQGHYRSDFPELKNQDHVNQARGTGARGMVHALEGRETN